MKPAVTVATAFLALIALAHLLRAALGVPVAVGGLTLPVWPSLPASLLVGTLAVLLWREAHR